MHNRLKRQQSILLTSTILSFLTVVVVLFLVLKDRYRVSEELKAIRESQTQETQFLTATLDYQTRKQKLTLYIRDIILNTWKRTGIKRGYQEAYVIAKATVNEADKYPYWDVEEYALFLTAQQKQESNFKNDAESPVGALGISQFMPATARTISSILQLEYSKDIFYDISTCIRMQATYMDIILKSHDKDMGAALAEYNGGPRAAYMYKIKSPKLYAETAKYVPEILARKKKYEADYKNYKVSFLSLDRDSTGVPVPRSIANEKK